MKRNALVVAVIAAVLVLGVWVYKAYQKNSTRNAVLASVQDTSERLRAAVAATPAGEPVDFDAHARAVEVRAGALRERDTSALRPLADAADDYLVTAREILRRRATMHSSRERLAKSLEELSRHMQADRGAADGTRQAVSLREPIDRDLREYRIATESYVTLLQSLAKSQAKISAYAAQVGLLDESTIKAARESALDALARTDENVRQVARLEPYRGQRAAPGR
jgi:hypothetical protein